MPRQTSHDRGDDEDDENTFRILVATDCHLGYMEKDSERSDDSLNTFEEILQHAQQNKVDMILLGGDLFHENKPSRKSLHGCMALLRQYCMGDKPVQFEYLSDPSVNFSTNPFPVVNYADPNMNVEIPVFSIHGNHDDPAGLGNLCALDVLSVAGLVNYFGKSPSLEDVKISPVLMKKGRTKLAMYGLGSIRDERLHRMFLQGKISMLRPKESSDTWFNMFVIHQNRAKHGEHNYIPEQFLDEFIDLVIWGHEHECLVEPVWNGTQNFFISQPGSSIATSLSPGESKKKHIALLQVRGKEMKCNKIPLETVRPFYIEDVCLLDTELDPEDVHAEKKVEAFCAAKIEELIAKAAEERSGSPKQPSLPLIRLRVDYSGGFSTFNVNRFGQRFVKKVANTRDLILFHKKREARTGRAEDTKPGEDFQNFLKPEALNTERVEDLVKEYFTSTDEAKQLELLSEKGLGDAIREFVEKKENDAIHELVKWQLERTQKHLKQTRTNEDRLNDELSKMKEERKKLSEAEEQKQVKEVLETVRQNRREAGGEEDVSDDDERKTQSSSDEDRPSTSRRGRGRGRGRGSRARGKSRGRQSRVMDNEVSSSFASSSRQEGRNSQVRQSTLTGSSFKKGTTKKRPINFEDDDDDVEEIPVRSSSKMQKNSKRRERSPEPVQVISDSDDDDPFSSMPSRKGGRRN